MPHPGHSAVTLGAPWSPPSRSSRAGRNERRDWVLYQMLCSPWSQIANFVIHTGEKAWLRSKINVKTSNVCFIPLSSSGTWWALTLLSPSTRDDTEHLLVQLQSCLLVTHKKPPNSQFRNIFQNRMTEVKLRRVLKKSWQQLFTAFHHKRTTGHPMEWEAVVLTRSNCAIYYSRMLWDPELWVDWIHTGLVSLNLMVGLAWEDLTLRNEGEIYGERILRHFACVLFHSSSH